MNLRRLIPTLLVLAATAVPAAAAVAEDNKVTAVNETDGAQIFQLSIDLQRITEGPVVDQNVAQVYSSCEDCRTIAIAVQVLLLMEDIRQVVPVNLAESINYECTRCESLAYAGQLVLSTGGKVRLTGDARRRIAEIEEALNALSASDATLFEIYAEIDRLVDDLKQTVIDGLVPVGNKRDRQEPGEPGGATDSDSGSGAGAGTATDVEQPDTETDGTAGVPDELTTDAGAPATADPATSTPTAPAATEPAPATATGDPAPTPGVTTPTTPTAEPAPADSTTTAPPPAEAPSTTESSTPTTTGTTTTSEPAPTTTTQPAPAETTTTTASEPAPEVP